jgi:hypothetical protein
MLIKLIVKVLKEVINNETGNVDANVEPSTPADLHAEQICCSSPHQRSDLKVGMILYYR